MAAGKLDFQLEEVDVAELGRRAVVAAQGHAATRGVEITFEAETSPAWVWADPDRTNQVLANLLSNAVKFSPKEGLVEVSLSQGAGGVRVEVRDHGPGIEEAFRGRIFQRFAQAEGSDTPSRVPDSCETKCRRA